MYIQLGAAQCEVNTPAPADHVCNADDFIIIKIETSTLNLLKNFLVVARGLENPRLQSSE